MLLQSKINLSVLASLTSIAAARAAQVWSRADVAVIVITVTKLTSHPVAAEQEKPFSAGEPNQHRSSACCSSVEQGAADIAVIVMTNH